MIVMTSRTYRQLIAEVNVFCADVKGIGNHSSIQRVLLLLDQVEEFDMSVPKMLLKKS